AGSAPVYGGAVDLRVARLQRLIAALAATEPMPTPYEVGVIFRITPSQARGALRTYEARFSREHRARMGAALKDSPGDARTVEKKKVWVFEFTDPAVLDYAVDALRRRGLVRTVAVDRTTLKLTVERDEVDRHGLDARAAIEAVAAS